MRLYKYLNEDNTHSKEEIGDTLTAKCSYYLKLIKVSKFKDFKTSIRFYRGDRKFNKSIIKLNTTERTPTSTNSEIFKIFNEWLKQNNHVPRNFSVSATSNTTHALRFSEGTDVAMIFPIGKFNYTYVKANDFNYTTIEYSGGDSHALIWLLRDKIAKKLPNLIQTDKSTGLITIDSIRAKTDNKIEATPEEGDIRADAVKKCFVTNKQIGIANKHVHEIGFDCKEYILVNTKLLGVPG